MKKIILIIVLVFSTGAITNANTNVKKETLMFLDCFDMANDLTNMYEQTHPHASYGRVYQEFAKIYDDCHSNTGM
jgi:hypothetical protein